MEEIKLKYNRAGLKIIPVLILSGAVVVPIGMLCSVEFLFIIGVLLFVGLIPIWIFMLIRDKADVLIYDYNGFKVRGKKYKYSDIKVVEVLSVGLMEEKVYEIYTDSKCIFKYDCKYQHYNDFNSRLEAKGVEFIERDVSRTYYR